MQYLLDTNICIYLIKEKPISVVQKLIKYDPDQILISSITVSELEYGVLKSKYQFQNKLALMKFIIPFQIKNYDQKAAHFYGEIRSYLEKKGDPIGTLDFLIVAQALSLDVCLITNNEKEFKKVPGLKVKNWVF
jgi:tRNA(fMet)-specific endonuclease VapC